MGMSRLGGQEDADDSDCNTSKQAARLLLFLRDPELYRSTLKNRWVVWVGMGATGYRIWLSR